MEEGLFDATPYEIPFYERVDNMGERPPMGRDDWIAVADQMHDEQNWDAMEEALRKAERAERFPQTLGQLSLGNFGSL